MATATAEKVTPIEEGKSLVQFSKALVKFDIQEKVIQDLEEATKLEITDAASEKVVRKHRQNAKTLEVQIEKTRLQLNRDFKDKTDSAAALIAPRITAAYNKLDEKVKAVEVEREARKAEKEEAERLRLGQIQWHMDGLEYDCNAGLEYNMSAEAISHFLGILREVVISAVDYEERTEEAEQKLITGIVATEAALENRKKFEADQAKLAEEKAKQEAEAKRLDEERVKMEAEQKAREEEARGKAEAEAEKRRQEEEKLRVEREAIDAENERLLTVSETIDGTKVEFEVLKEEDWGDGIQINEYWKKIASEKIDYSLFQNRIDEYNDLLLGQMIKVVDRLNELAIADHKQYKASLQAEEDRLRADAKARWEATEKARAEAAARAKLVGPDKAALASVVDHLDTVISDFETPEFKTSEATKLVLDCVAGLRAEIHKLELGAQELA